jgi:SAM-dependent methyltransferase
VTFDEQEAAVARLRLDTVITGDLNVLDPAAFGVFDCVICSHVLEHLQHPDALLEKLHRCLAPEGTMILAVPNVLFWRQRFEFLRGRFRYTDGGLMDKTHYRFFDWTSVRSLPLAAGYSIEQCVADGSFPLSRRLWGTARRRLDNAALAWFPGLFAWQFVLRCQPARGAAHLA